MMVDELKYVNGGGYLMAPLHMVIEWLLQKLLEESAHKDTHDDISQYVFII
jgi:hypothetical protein